MITQCKVIVHNDSEMWLYYRERTHSQPQVDQMCVDNIKFH